MAARRVAVAGGGLAGLAAGLELKRLGCRVELFERSRLLGGKATSFRVDGVEVDNGQHVFLGCCTAFLDFLRELGLERAVSLQERFRVTVLRPGRRPATLEAATLPAPWHLLAGLLAYPGLGWREKLEVSRALAGARRPAGGLSFGGWLERERQGPRARKDFWEPFFVPALNAPPEEVDAEAALFVARTAFLSDAGAARFGFVTVPLGRVAEAAAARFDAVHLRAPVAEIRPGPSLRLAGGATVEVDGVVAAVPPQQLGRLGELGLEGLEAFRSAPIVDVHLWYDRDLPFDFATVLESPLQWVFRKGGGYACCSLSAAEREVGRPSAELVADCDAALREAVPELAAARLLRGAATRDPEATFVPAPGLRRPGPATSLAGVVVAGSWTDTGWPATMESAVRSGRTAARLLAAQLSGREVAVA